MNKVFSTFRILSAIIVLASGVATVTAQVRVLTLDETLKLADEQSLDIRKARITLERSMKAIETAKATLTPEVTFGGDVTWYPQRPVMFLPPNTPLNPGTDVRTVEVGSMFSTGLNASLTYPLYDPMKSAQQRVAETNTGITKAQLQAARAVVRMNAVKGFYRALYARTERDLRRQQIDVAMKNLQTVLARFQQGRSTPLDTLTANTTVVRAQAQAERADYNDRAARMTLAQILDISNYETIEVKGTLAIPSPPGPSGGDDISSVAATLDISGKLSSPAEQFALAKRASAQIQRETDNAALHPIINAVGKTQLLGQDNSLDPSESKWVMVTQFGLNATYYLSNLWRNDPKRQETEIGVQEAEMELLQVRRTDSVQLEQLLLKMKGAKAQVNAEAASVEQAKKAVEIATILYKEGRATLLELESTQSKLLDAQLAEDRASLEFFDAVAELQALLVR